MDEKGMGGEILMTRLQCGFRRLALVSGAIVLVVAVALFLWEFASTPIAAPDWPAVLVTGLVAVAVGPAVWLLIRLLGWIVAGFAGDSPSGQRT